MPNYTDKVVRAISGVISRSVPDISEKITPALTKHKTKVTYILSAAGLAYLINEMKKAVPDTPERINNLDARDFDYSHLYKEK